MKNTSILRVSILTLFCLVVICQTGFTWPGVAIGGVAICTAAQNQESNQIISDNQGGAIITWQDYRSDQYDIYAQSINSTGTVKWKTDGIGVCTTSTGTGLPKIVSDGQSGAIITWMDMRNGYSNIFAQGINSNGTIKWTTDGVTICTVGAMCYYPQIISDGKNGAFIAWYDDRHGISDLYIQNIDSTGTVKWMNNGVPLCVGMNYSFNPQLVSDGHGGAIITWENRRNDLGDIYAQAVDSTGTVKWTVNGVAICETSTGQTLPQIASDGQGGAIITWMDGRRGSSLWDIYAQAIDSTGGVKWTSNGVAICTVANACFYPKILSYGKSGAIITWQDNRNGNNDIFAQAISSTGAAQWTSNGTSICVIANEQTNPNIVPDGQGGVLIGWLGINSAYAQSIDSTGTWRWNTNGAGVSVLGYPISNPQIVSDGNDGAIMSWEDTRNYNTDIYAQSISKYGVISGPKTTDLVDLKLFKNESHNSAFNIPDQFPAAAQFYTYTLFDNFRNLCTVNGDSISQGAYASAATGINSIIVNNGFSFGASTGFSAVKYSTYKLKKLPYIGIIPKTTQDFPIYQYAFNSTGLKIPESFGKADALSVSDTTKISAAWLTSSTIRITATSSLVTSAWVDIIASSATSKPFGADIDRERLWVFSSLLTTAGFAYANDTKNFVYQNAMDKTVLAVISHVTVMSDRNGLSAAGAMKITFSSGSSGVKATLGTTQWKNYKTAQWYTVRMRLFSPDTGNQHQALLYQYDNPVAAGNHIDLGAYVCFGIPTVWTWVEQSLYCQQSGSGYPQLILKAGSAGTVYVDEIQLINTSPAILSNLRLPGNLKYVYGQFSTANDTTGWGYQSVMGTSVPSIIPPFNVNDGVLGLDFLNAGPGTKLMGFKATATNAVPGKIYTPENLPNAEIGMKLDFAKYFGQATSTNSLVALYMFGVQTSGQFDIGKPLSELIATGEFGSLKSGTHWVIGKTLTRYHQFQYVIKNDLSSILTLDNIEMFQDRDSNEYGDFSLYP